MTKLRLILIIFLALLVVFYAGLWFFSRARRSVEFGIGFDYRYASWLQLDWKKAYTAMLDDLKPVAVRLPVAWDDVEREQGKFNFADIDWQLKEAEKRGVKVMLVVGQKVPRWPECHIPEWITKKQDIARTRTFEYVKTVVERYRKHPALEFWQVENEPFIKFEFGNCKFFHPEIVVEEVNLVRSLDKNHKIVVTDSGELGLWWRAGKLGDYLGTTVYRRILTSKKWAISYFYMPPSVYRLKAWLLGGGVEKLMVSELQAEPWFAGTTPNTTPIAEQEKTLNNITLRKNIDFGRRIGVGRVYLWGVEWWYWMKEVKKDSSYWDIVREEIAKG